MHAAHNKCGNAWNECECEDIDIAKQYNLQGEALRQVNDRKIIKGIQALLYWKTNRLPYCKGHNSFECECVK